MDANDEDEDEYPFRADAVMSSLRVVSNVMEVSQIESAGRAIHVSASCHKWNELQRDTWALRTRDKF